MRKLYWVYSSLAFVMLASVDEPSCGGSGSTGDVTPTVNITNNNCNINGGTGDCNNNTVNGGSTDSADSNDERPFVTVPVLDVPPELAGLTYEKPNNIPPPPPAVDKVLERARRYHDEFADPVVEGMWDNRPTDALVNVYQTYGSSNIPYYAAGILDRVRGEETIETAAIRFLRNHWHTAGFCDPATPGCTRSLQSTRPLAWARRDYDWGGTVTELSLLQQDANGVPFSAGGLTLTFHGTTLTSVSGVYFGPLDGRQYAFRPSDTAVIQAYWAANFTDRVVVGIDLVAKTLLLRQDGSELLPVYEYQLRDRPTYSSDTAGEGDEDAPSEPTPAADQHWSILIAARTDAPNEILAVEQAFLEEKNGTAAFDRVASALNVQGVSAKGGALGVVFPDQSANRKTWNDNPTLNDRVRYTLLEGANSHVLEAGAADPGRTWQQRSAARPGYLDGTYVTVFAANNNPAGRFGRRKQNCLAKFTNDADGCWQVASTADKIAYLPTYVPYVTTSGVLARSGTLFPASALTSTFEITSATRRNAGGFPLDLFSNFPTSVAGHPADKTDNPLFSTTTYYWIDRFFRYHLDPYTKKDLGGSDIPLEDKLTVLVNGGGTRDYQYIDDGSGGLIAGNGGLVCNQRGSCTRSRIFENAGSTSQSFEAVVLQAFAKTRPDGLFGPKRRSSENADSSGFHQRPKIMFAAGGSTIDPDGRGGVALGVVYHETMHYVNRVALGRFRRLPGWPNYGEARGLDEGLAYAYASLVLDDPIDFIPTPTNNVEPQDLRWIDYNQVMGGCGVGPVGADDDAYFSAFVPGIAGTTPKSGCCKHRDPKTWQFSVSIPPATLIDYSKMPWACIPQARTWGGNNRSDIVSLSHGLSDAAGFNPVGSFDLDLGSPGEKQRFRETLDFNGAFGAGANAAFVPDANFPKCAVTVGVSRSNDVLNFSRNPAARSSDFDSESTQCGKDSGNIYIIGDLVSQIVWELTHSTSRVQRPCQDGAFRQAFLESVSQMGIDSTVPQFFEILEYQLYMHGWDRNICDPILGPSQPQQPSVLGGNPSWEALGSSQRWTRERLLARGVFPAPARSLCYVGATCSATPTLPLWPRFGLPPVEAP